VTGTGTGAADGSGDARGTIEGDEGGDARGTIEGDEGGESPCLAHLVDDPPALPDDRLAQLVTRLAGAAARAGDDSRAGDDASGEREARQQPAGP
jgi:hypothetical protein